MISFKNTKIGIIGLGYVGLPLSVEFGKFFKTVGFDINPLRIDQLMDGIDITNELTLDQLRESKDLVYTSNVEDLTSCNIFIVTVPTPIDDLNNPDLRPLINASKTIASILKKNDLVIYESTVYPGATEEVCVPILESFSGLKYNEDFFCGYSPERINPGDKNHTIRDIRKVTSGSNSQTADLVDDLYKVIIEAGTFKAVNIRTAEAAKVIENTQRDINIALINELSKIFNRLDIDTEAVLEAASTKWNFIPFKPGLVGGHCIGIDPYYLTHKSIESGYKPEIILAGRKLNNGMGSYVVEQVSSLMNKKQIQIFDSNILILGITFKENCPDIRNSKVFDLINGFLDLECNVEVYDPWVNKSSISKKNNITLIEEPSKNHYDSIVIAVAHDQFKELSIDDFKAYAKKNHIIYDLKYVLSEDQVDGRL